MFQTNKQIGGLLGTFQHPVIDVLTTALATVFSLEKGTNMMRRKLPLDAVTLNAKNVWLSKETCGRT